MLPVIAIIGRPNVGKSTLFNCLTQRRDALVGDMPGLTRDRQYGEGHLGEQAFIVIDTGGLAEQEQDIDTLMAKQTERAIAEADILFFMVDGRAGLAPGDQAIGEQLRKINKPLYLIVNKIDSRDPDIVTAEFHALALGMPYGITAAQGRGVHTLLAEALEPLLQQAVLPESESVSAGIKIAIVGRPNAGKSTLVNRMLGEERVVVYDLPGTTRDSIYIPFERRGVHYVLIDTAGVRRRSRVTEVVEKFSVIKTLQAIEASQVAIMVIDARVGVSDQDLHLIGFIVDAGKALVIAINKWDGMSEDERQKVKNDIDRRLNFINFAKIQFISALHGTGVGDLFGFVDKAYRAATQKLSTPQLTRILEAAVATHQPPLVRGRRVKLRYAHAGGHNPPLIVIHGSQTQALPDAYRRYLIGYFREALKLLGTPIRLELQDSANPYAGRKNPLTERQIRKRKRLVRHVKR